MYKYIWRIRKSIDGLFYDERRTARTRFWFFICLTLCIILLGYTLFENVDTSTLEESLGRPDGFNPYSYLIFWGKLSWIRFSAFVQHGFRHAIIPIFMFVGVLLASAEYIRDIYELPSFKLALRYMLASFWGYNYPTLTIEDGEKKIAKGTVNLIDTIGGPGYVYIRPGNVVLFESLVSPSSVRSAARHFISRFESVKEIVSLDDQHGFIEAARAKTKDGIQLVVRDIHYRYRLRTGRRFGDHEKRRAGNPYRFSVEAVKDMAYNRSMRGDQLSDWHTTVRLAIDGAITDYIKAHKFDHLTAPTYSDDDPRKTIADRMMGAGTRGRLRNIGAELLWFDIGHFDVADQKPTIEEQRVDTWSARWDGDAMIIRAHGEARRMAYQEIGRAEGQADMLRSIIQSLEETGFDLEGATEEQRLRSLRGIVWTRVAQILDTIAEEDQNNSASGQLPPRSPNR